MFVKTQAVKITEETYPLCVATLAGGFVEIPTDRVFGSYLLINRLTPQYDENTMGSQLVLENSWLSAEDFHELYDFVPRERKDRLTEVMAIATRSEAAQRKAQKARLERSLSLHMEGKNNR